MESRPGYEHPGYSQVQAWLTDEPGKVEEHQNQEGSCKEREDFVHGLLSEAGGSDSWRMYRQISGNLESVVSCGSVESPFPAQEKRKAGLTPCLPTRFWVYLYEVGRGKSNG